MKTKRFRRLAGSLIVGCTALATAAYVTHAVVTWCRYGGSKQQVRGDDVDSLLDLYLPEYEVVERHHQAVGAPAEIAFSAACRVDLSQSAIVRALFRLRELVLSCLTTNATPTIGNGNAQGDRSPKELLAQVKAIGWGVLAEVPGHEIVFGAVTQPWLANPVFRAMPPEEFARFRDPGHVKIAWTVRTDPISSRESIVRTQTRVMTTDPLARAKFRRYWSMVSLGVVLIRKALLQAVKKEAERRTRAAQPEYENAEFGQYAG